MLEHVGTNAAQKQWLRQQIRDDGEKEEDDNHRLRIRRQEGKNTNGHTV